MPTNTQKIATLEAWTKAHDTAHKANPLHAATHSHPDLAADIDETNQALSAHILDVPPPVDPPPVDPPGSVIVPFPAGGTPAALVALMANLSTDVIEVGRAGAEIILPRWAAFINVARPSTRPLLVRPAPGATVIFDGDGGANPAFRFGWAAQPALASNITFDPTGGRFVFQNYRIGLAGIVMARWTENVTFNGGEVVNCLGTGQLQHSHVIYLGTDGTHRGKNWRSNDWIIDGPSSRTLNGLHVYGEPNYDGVEALRWEVDELHRWAYLWAGTGILLDGWEGKNSNATIDASGGNAKGVVKGCHATNSGPLARGSGYWPATSGVLDGGGNTA